MGMTTAGHYDVSLVEGHIFSAIGFPPSSKKIGIEEILKFGNNLDIRVVKRTADKMISDNCRLYSEDGIYVFSRDSEGKYFWEQKVSYW